MAAPDSRDPRVALVTGAARGIGAATVATLAEAGWRGLAVDCVTDDPDLPYALGTPAELEQVAAGAGANVATFQADVRDVDALARAVAAAEDRWGHLDAALAVAGVIARGVPAWEAPAATRGLPMLSAYCAAKAGVAGFIRALGTELRDSGVTANAVSPGSTATPILDESARLYGLPSAGSFAAQQPLGRLLDPAEVAAVLAFLAGDGASAMTGAVIPVDGGLPL